MDVYDPTIPWHARLTLLWTEVQSAMTVLFRSQVQNPSGAEDVLQQTAMVVASKFDEYDTSCPFLALAISITKLKVPEYRRSHKFDRLFLHEAAVNVVAKQHVEQLTVLSDRAYTLHRYGKKLNGKSRQLISMRYEHCVFNIFDRYLNEEMLGGSETVALDGAAAGQRSIASAAWSVRAFSAGVPQVTHFNS